MGSPDHFNQRVMVTPISTKRVEDVKSDALNTLLHISDLDSLDEWRVQYLGRKAQLTQLLRGLSSAPENDRAQIGAAANIAKTVLEEQLRLREADLKAEHLSGVVDRERIDVTLPGLPVPEGKLHPTTRMVREITTAFASMGFQIEEGPEIEYERYNFDMLNIPSDHPARDMWDTLWIDQARPDGYRPLLLRTHTSPMQARVMENIDPPVRVVVPGKCYRYEATDSTHEWHFYQVEGLAVGEGITFADLKGTLYEFARRIFGEDRKIRFRCDFFPFVEPGVDMSISNFKDKDGNRPINRDEDWIEILGAGMVHPKVLEGVGYDPDRYTGFAFGMGVERIAMLKYGIDDIRLFYSNNTQFISQF